MASDSTAFRVIEKIASEPELLEGLREAHARARERFWERHGAPQSLIDVDATLVTAHSEKEGAAGTWKGGFGFHPLQAYADETREALAGKLRPGDAGSNTTADHKAVLDLAIAQVPVQHIEGLQILVSSDSAGAPQTGADDDRPGWSELIAEARDRRNRRFDSVVLYSTSRLSLNGGMAPYGYQRKTELHTNPARAAAGETKSRLVIDPDEAPIVLQIFVLWTVKELGVTAIADLLNERTVPCPTATNPRVNATRRWSKATINAMLRNPVYLGKQVWDRRDNATRREMGGSAPWRAEDEWTVCEDGHEPIISEELFGTAQERLQRKRKSSSRPEGRRHEHLLSGMVRCATEHPSLSAYGAVVKGHTYYRCTYGRSYGKVAADSIAGHGAACNVREDALLLAVEQFFAERLFGPMRLDLPGEQLGLQEQNNRTEAKRTAARLQAQIAEADHAIAMQVRALESGIEPDVVRARIEELKVEKATAQASLPKLRLAPERQDPAALLDQVPDLSERLRGADDATTFDLRVLYDKANGRLSISATRTEAVAAMLRTGLEPLCNCLLRGWDSNPQPLD